MENKITFKIDFFDSAKGALRDIKVNVNGVSDAVDTVTSSVKTSNSAFEKMAKASFGFNQVKEVFNGLGSAIESITGPSKTFEESMMKANTMANLGAEAFDKMKSSIRGLSREMPIARDLLADGLYQVISNGVPENNWLDFLEQSTKASVGGVADLGNVVTVTSTLIKNYGLEWDSALSIQDKIQNTAKYGVTSFEQLGSALPRVSGNAATLGVNIDELLATFATLTGVSGNTAEVSTQLSAVFTSLIKPTSQAAKLAEEMGISFDAISIKKAGGMLPFVQQLEKDITAYTERTGELKENVYGTLFGSAEAMRAILPLTGELATSFEEKSGLIQNSAGTIDAAFEQMNSSANSFGQRMKNTFQGIGDYVFEFTGKWGVAIQSLASGGRIISELGGVVSVFGALFKKEFFTNIIGGIGKSITWFGKMGKVFRLQMAFMNADLLAGSMASLGFRGNMIRATLSLVRFATVGIFQALKGMGALVLSLITGGATSATFAAISTTAFTAFSISAVGAFRAVSVAIMNVPIIGWIAAIIAGLIAVGVYFWNTSAKFKATLTGTWESFKTFFTSVYDMAKGVFGSIYDMIAGAFSGDLAQMKRGFSGVQNFYKDVGESMATAYREGYDGVMAKDAEERAARDDQEVADDLGLTLENYRKIKVKAEEEGISVEQYIQKKPGAAYGQFEENNYNSDPIIPPNPVSDGIKNIAQSNITGGGASVKQIHINIESLIGENTNMFREGETITDAHEFMDKMTHALQMAVNNVN